MKNLTATYKGLITGVAMMLASIICYFVLHIPFNSKEQFIVFAIYGAGIIWSLLDYRKTHQQENKLKAYFQEGFKTFIVVTLLMVIYCIVFYKMETGIRDAWIANNNVELLKQGNHMPAEIAENAKQMKAMFLPMMIGINVFKYLIIGVLITIITGGFLISQKKN